MNARPDFLFLKKDTLYTEKIVLLRLCSFNPSPEDKHQLEQLIASVKDWRMFAYMAKANGISALLYKNIVDLKLEGIDKSCTAEFLHEFHSIKFRNTLKIIALKQLVTLLENDSIHYVVLRGYQFIRRYYMHLFYRDIGDLDFLIDPDSFEKAVRLMEKHPYRLITMPYEHHLMYIDTKHNVQIELHHDIISPPHYFKYALSEFLKNTVLYKDNEITVRVLNNRYELYLQLMNALYAHAFVPFKARNIVDVYAVMLSMGADAPWEEIIKQVNSTGALNYLLISARICHDFFNVPMPQVFQQYVEESRFKDKYEYFIGYLFHYMEYIKNPKFRKNPALLQIRLANTPANSVRLLYHYLFLSAKYVRYSRLKLRVPIFLFHVIRLFLLPFRFIYKSLYTYIRNK